MKRPLILLLAPLSLFSGGCCFLPIPVYYTHGPGVSGKVLETGTDRPIEKAKILVRSASPNCADRFATTTADGSFRIPAAWDIHFGFWAGTPSSGTCLPFALFDDGDGISRRFYSIEIEADGYEPDNWTTGPYFHDPAFPDFPHQFTPPTPEDGIYRLRPFGDRPDSDGDGLLDRDELRIHFTDFNNPDTDGDGFTDGEEVKAGSNPLDRTSHPATPSPAEETHAESAETREGAGEAEQSPVVISAPAEDAVRTIPRVRDVNGNTILAIDGEEYTQIMLKQLASGTASSNAPPAASAPYPPPRL